jgi:UDP-N-acetylmuramoyl-tripeptide--D-alanyl-D-alanine ligase
MKITMSEILESTGGKLLYGGSVKEITFVSIDSRNIKENSLFVPIKGENFDGHDFIAEAFEAGAVAAFIEKDKNTEPYDGILIEVSDACVALQSLAAYCFKKLNIPAVGITGSVGKSSVKEMLASIFDKAGIKIFKTQGNLNGQLGLPLTILNSKEETQTAVIEMGVSLPGEMEKLVSIAPPDYSIITNIGMSHLQNFITEENIFFEKIKIASKKNCKVYINHECKKYLKEIPDNYNFFGLNDAEKISQTENGMEFSLNGKTFELPCFGFHNVCNALAAISVAESFGVETNLIKKGLQNFSSLPMRQQITEIDGITIIDDTYNASPDSFRASIEILQSMNGNRRKIVVAADMLELGSNSEQAHFEIGKSIAVGGADVLVSVGKLAEFFIKGAETIERNMVLRHFESSSETAEFLTNEIGKDDIVLFKGSRGMHVDEIVRIVKFGLDKA